MLSLTRLASNSASSLRTRSAGVSFWGGWSTAESGSESDRRRFGSRGRSTIVVEKEDNAEREEASAGGSAPLGKKTLYDQEILRTRVRSGKGATGPEKYFLIRQRQRHPTWWPEPTWFAAPKVSDTARPRAPGRAARIVHTRGCTGGSHKHSRRKHRYRRRVPYQLTLSCRSHKRPSRPRSWVMWDLSTYSTGVTKHCKHFSYGRCVNASLHFARFTGGTPTRTTFAHICTLI